MYFSIHYYNHTYFISILYIKSRFFWVVIISSSELKYFLFFIIRYSVFFPVESTLRRGISGFIYLIPAANCDGSPYSSLLPLQWYIYTFEPFFSFSTVMLAAVVLNKIRRDRDERLEKKETIVFFTTPTLTLLASARSVHQRRTLSRTSVKKISIDCRCRGLQRSFFAVLIKLPSFFRFFAVLFFPFFFFLSVQPNRPHPILSNEEL